MKVSARVRVSGPLSECIAGFTAKLAARGYSDLSLANQLRLAAHFSRWLEQQHLEEAEITARLLDSYLRLRRRTRTGFRSRRALMPLLEHLGLTRILHDDVPKQSAVLERYRRHLRDERGLSATVRAGYEALARDFLGGRRPETLKTADVVGYVQQHAGQPGLVGRLCALRSFLRFLHAADIVSTDLKLAVPSTPCWRQASLPRALDAAQVCAVLRSCDRRTTIGRRDYAVVLLMVRLGLRACEVAVLSLDGIDWIAGEIVVKGKGSMSRLPLPVDVGEALVAWLRRRRRGVSTRALFLASRAPYGAASVSAIRSIAQRSLRKAGVPSGSGHRLRHTAATWMLRRGASLTEIAQVLRHRHVDTTAIYAKVDRATLGSLACPWPVGYAVDRTQLSTLAQPWPGGVT